MSETISFTIIILGMILLAVTTQPSSSVSEFLYNAFYTRFNSIVMSTVVSQIGAGSVITVYAISIASPLTGVLIAVSIGLGLLTIALILPRIIVIGNSLNSNGLLELILNGHDCNPTQATLFLLPVYLIVMLKMATQLLALSLVISTVFPIDSVLATLISIGLLFTYILIAGYQAATVTDNFQFLVVLGFAGLVFYFLQLPVSFVELLQNTKYPNYFPWLIFAMLYLTTITSLPHWRRAVTAENVTHARWAFALSAPMVTSIILIFTTSGFVLGQESGTSTDGFKLLFPHQLGWIIHAGMFMAIISSMDTLMLSLIIERRNTTLKSIRLQVLIICVVISIAAILFGDIVKTMVSTYSALLSLFPAALMVFLGRASDARVMILSVFAGVLASFITWQLYFTLVPVSALLASSFTYAFSHLVLHLKTRA